MYRLLENRGTAAILPKSEVLNYDQLSSYEWTGNFLKSEKLQEKIDHLKEERREVEARPISNSEKLVRVRAGYADFQKTVAAQVKRYLNEPSLWQNGVQNPLQRFEIRFCRQPENFFCPPLTMFEEAIRNQPDDGISDAERSSKLAKIDNKIAELKTETPLVSPACKAYVAWWREIQSQLNENSGPRALHLDASPEIEKKAWKELGLAEYVDKKSSVRPNPAD
jgi:hypothetical protein